MKRLAAVVLLACVGCSGHKQPAALDLLNDQARISVPDDVLKWRVLTTGVDRAAGTAYSLFGDDAAVLQARGGPATGGATWALVTWRQREDPHWFGARIVGDPVSVEVVTQGAGAPVYRKYSGKPLVVDSAPEVAGRAAAILEMKVPRLP